MDCRHLYTSTGVSYEMIKKDEVRFRLGSRVDSSLGSIVLSVKYKLVGMTAKSVVVLVS